MFNKNSITKGKSKQHTCTHTHKPPKGTYILPSSSLQGDANMFFEPLEALLKALLNPGVGLLFMYSVHSPWKVSPVFTLPGK